MTVHLIASELTSDRILARLGRHLIGGLGWTWGSEPDAGAELNVFWPYLEHRKHAGWAKTPTAGWFTHYEPDDPMRARCWQEAAEALTLRVTPAAMYARMLECYGPTIQIRHPVEEDKFTWEQSHKALDAPRTIGVAGWVYPGGRKGEHLVERLARERPEWVLVASGQGWPIRECSLYNWEAMQVFYRGLDAFLVTSLIEGGPVTMLEALACGVPVVIPTGVGECDEIQGPGVYHYPAGDYMAMTIALQKAIDAGHDPQALRAIVAERTPTRWCAMWHRAVASLQAEPTRGAYIVAYGERARECATELLRTLHDRSIQAAVVSDEPLDGADVMTVEPQTDNGGRDQKTRMYELSPFDHTLYCDADTLAVGDVTPFFALLDQGYEMVFTASPNEYAQVARSFRHDRVEEFNATLDELPTDTLLQPSGGVLAFRRCAGAERFFHRWYAEWGRWGRTDQLALMRALYAEPVRYAWLPTEWNYYAHHGAPERAVGFLHFPTAARAWGQDNHPGRELWEKWRAKV